MKDGVRAKKPRISTTDLLEKPSLQAFRDTFIQMTSDLSLAEAKTLTHHLRSIAPAKLQLRLAFIHTYTSDLLDPWLDFQAARETLEIDTYHAPYGLNVMEAAAGSGLEAHQPDMTVLLLQREDLHPDLRYPVTGLDGGARRQLRQAIVDDLSAIVGQFRIRIQGQIVVTVLPPTRPLELGLFDRQAEGSEATFWGQVKDDIAGSFRDRFSATMLFDLDDMLADIGHRVFCDQRLWYSTRFPFSPVAACEFARRLISLAVVLNHPKAKVIVLDADNTLWGGVIGEDGMDGIALGPDYPGNVYVEFQRRLLNFQQRGFILAMCSKNNPEDVDEVIDSHPHQVLRDAHFAARRVNWDPKSDNLQALAGELNLGLESFIFVDDSDYECDLIRRALPQVEVIQMPSRPVDVPSTLDRVSRLEIVSRTKEDLAKTQLYGQERQRRELQETMVKGNGSVADFLASLQMSMTVEIDALTGIARLAQLTQKTNQFNLTTRRYSEEAIADFIRSDDWIVGSFSLSDKFGHSGVVGLALLRRSSGSQAVIDTFLMSCRVIGRKAESAFLEAVLGYAQTTGTEVVIAEYLPTPKNRLVESFLPDHRFIKHEDGRYWRVLEAAPPAAAAEFPIDVELRRPEGCAREAAENDTSAKRKSR